MFSSATLRISLPSTVSTVRGSRISADGAVEGSLLGFSLGASEACAVVCRLCPSASDGKPDGASRRILATATDIRTGLVNVLSPRGFTGGNTNLSGGGEYSHCMLLIGTPVGTFQCRASGKAVYVELSTGVRRSTAEERINQSGLLTELKQRAEKLETDLAVSLSGIAELERAKAAAELALKQAEQARLDAENANREIQRSNKREIQTRPSLKR
jgi:hypothetical protein